MSGSLRLFILISAVWVLLVAVLSGTDYQFNWSAFLGFGFLPPFLAWGIYWVVQGFCTNAAKAPTTLSGSLRLFILISAVWVLLVAVLAGTDYQFNWSAFLGFGFLPPFLAWGIYWVVQGFRTNAAKAPTTLSETSVKGKRRIGWASSLKVWWSFSWRGALYGAPLGFVFGFVAGIIAGNTENAAFWGALAGWFAGIPASMLALKQALIKHLPSLAAITDGQEEKRSRDAA
jgi:hypothetical protein